MAKKPKEEKNHEGLFIEKHVEIRTHEYKGIKITVKIDYDYGHISFVQPEKNSNPVKYTTKQWVFVGRGVEYMQGWQDIFEALEHVTKIAKEDLEGYQKVRDSYNLLMVALSEK